MIEKVEQSEAGVNKRKEKIQIQAETNIQEIKQS